jgi:hypothetical protein
VSRFTDAMELSRTLWRGRAGSVTSEHRVVSGLRSTSLAGIDLYNQGVKNGVQNSSSSASSSKQLGLGHHGALTKGSTNSSEIESAIFHVSADLGFSPVFPPRVRADRERGGGGGGQGGEGGGGGRDSDSGGEEKKVVRGHLDGGLTDKEWYKPRNSVCLPASRVRATRKTFAKVYFPVSLCCLHKVTLY